MTSPQSSPSESPERQPLREALELIAEQCEEHPLYMPDATETDLEREGGDAASVTYWAQTARKALLARPEGQPTGWVAIQDNRERVLHLSRAHGWRVEEVLTEPNAAGQGNVATQPSAEGRVPTSPPAPAAPESAAPQPSTATVSTAPSNEGVGPGEVAVAADSPSEKPQPSDTPETDNVHYGCALYESDVERYRDMAEHASSLERQRNEALGRERLANMRADQAEEARDAAREIANEATALLEAPVSATLATRELANIANAERFNRERFRDDTEFADWAVSRCKHALAAADKTASDKGQG